MSEAINLDDWRVKIGSKLDNQLKFMFFNNYKNFSIKGKKLIEYSIKSCLPYKKNNNVYCLIS
jgi:hypothetical protein